VLFHKVFVVCASSRHQSLVLLRCAA
jgi:hypothetical protein